MTIAFGDSVRITKLSLSQLPSSLSYTPFTQFQISYSQDQGITYSYLPSSISVAPLGALFNYSISGDYIDCDHLRVHILDVANRTGLLSLRTGLSILGIYGIPPSNYCLPVTSRLILLFNKII